MNQWVSKLLTKLIPGASEKTHQHKLKTKYMPYKGAYFFTHVPKTGGTSFIVFLDRFFPAKVIFPHQLWIEVGDFKQVDKQAYNLIRGHFGGCAIDVLSDKEIKYLTILRDPVKLAYSTYEYVRREQNTALHQFVVAENMSFETFLSHPRTKHLVSDRMVHNLVFGHNYDKSVENMVLTDKSFSQFRKRINKGQKELTNEQRLQISKSFIDRCLWFGVLERYDDAVRLLCYTMAWPPQGQSQRLNVNKIKPVITAEAKATALAQNTLDSAVYEYAIERFNQEYEQMLGALNVAPEIGPTELDEVLDRHYQNNYVDRYNYRLTDHIDYDFSEILLGSQWHRREWNALGQYYFRWTGPGNTSSIDFWMLPNNYRITIHTVDAINKNFLDQLKIDINNKDKSVVERGGGKSRTLQVECQSAEIGANGLLRINFHSQGLQSHKSYFSSDDSRVVGFAVRSIQIEKID